MSTLWERIGERIKDNPQQLAALQAKANSGEMLSAAEHRVLIGAGIPLAYSQNVINDHEAAESRHRKQGVMAMGAVLGAGALAGGLGTAGAAGSAGGAMDMGVGLGEVAQGFGVGGGAEGLGAVGGEGLLDFLGGDAMSSLDTSGFGGAFDAGGMGVADAAGGAMDMGVGLGDVFSGAGAGATNMEGLTAALGKFGLTPGDLAKMGLNFGVNSYLGNKQEDIANQAANKGDALQQQQRAPFQQAALGMVQNPQDYLQNNPFATAMTSHFKNNVIPANVAKSGNTGFEADRLGGQFATALGQNYNELLGTLMGYGGFNQGAGYSGAAYGSAATQGNQFNAEAFRGLGNVAEKIFGNPQQPKTPTANALTGSYTLVQ